MTWYTGHFGSWKDPHGLQRIDGTYHRNEMFDKARQIANERRVEVTIIESRPTGHGLRDTVYTVKPE